MNLKLPQVIDAILVAMKTLPSNVKAYKRTPLFTGESIPAALLNKHNTKAGSWGLINVEEGELEYQIENGESYILSPSFPGVVEPEVFHHVRAIGKVVFYVEFYQTKMDAL